jgi:RNA polymerase sigma factor (sigma-70 family)
MEVVEQHEAASVEPVTTDFVECYVHHYSRLVRALRLGGADPGTAEELAQEAFARALTRWRRISRGTNPPGYVYTTGFRLLHRHLKRASRWDVGEPPEPYGVSSEPTTRLAVESILAGMPARRRACAVMCLITGLTPHEAAEALGIADGTVRKHLEEARKDLAAIQL